MRLPFQLALNFHGDKTNKTQESEIPIDKYFPEEAANELATLESYNKHLYRPNTYLHKWWARRSGTTFRYILKQLVLNPEKRDFYEGGGLEGRIVFDPMMGGGTTLHEAIRMGANVIGVDIDPVPVLQVKASLTQSSLHHKKEVFNGFLHELKKQLDYLFESQCPICGNGSETQFTLYGLRRRCSCREVIFVDSFVLRKGNSQDIQICPLCQNVYTGSHHTCNKESPILLMEKGAKHCEKCDTGFADVIDEPFSARYTPLVTVGACPDHGPFFKSVDNNDLALLKRAYVRAKQIDLGDPKAFVIASGPKSKDLLRRDINNYQELFTPRQLIYLGSSSKFLSELPVNNRSWLALLISTSLEFNSLLCGYKGRDVRRPGAIRHVFSHHAYSFPYMALENNPVFSGNTSGTLKRLFNDRIVKASQWAVEPVETHIIKGKRKKRPILGEIDAAEPVQNWEDCTKGIRKFYVLQGDSSAIDFPDGLVNYVVTDPPYFDNVQYSDLSNFFRVWLQWFLPHEADWQYEQLGSAVCEGDRSACRKYGQVLGGIWKQCFRALKIDYGRLIFTFHHWNPEAWAELTLSLKSAGFSLVNSYVVFSENPISVHIRGLKSLKHDTILVLKPGMAAEESKKWPRITEIEISDSFLFCRGCGTALGWFLESNLTEEDIRAEWKRLIGEINNGKASG